MDLGSYVLTFADEFDTFSWSPNGDARWKTKFYFGDRVLSRNAELGYYSDATVGTHPFRLENGALVITAAPGANVHNLPYDTGLITTETSFAQTYGYFEMRAQLPEGKGLWPVFWMLPTSKRWPPEIDVFEVHGDKPHQVHINAIDVKGSSAPGNDWVEVTGDVTDGYHTYGVNWTASTITYYFDGQTIGQFATPENMHTPMYILASLAVGGNWPGRPDQSTPFPAEMKIDYIRAYSDQPGAVAIPSPARSVPDPVHVTAPAAARSAPAVAPQPWGYRVPDKVYVGTTGDDYISTRYGELDPMFGGKGNDTYRVTDFRQSVVEYAGEGIDTLDLWADYTLPLNVENAYVSAGYGVQVVGNALSNTLRGGKGNDLLDGRGGDDVLTGGLGRDVFWVRAGRGYDIITDFKAGTAEDSDVLALSGYGLSDFAAVKAAMRQQGADVLLTLDNGETVLLQNQRVENLVAQNIVLNSVMTPLSIPTTTTPTSGTGTSPAPTTGGGGSSGGGGGGSGGGGGGSTSATTTKPTATATAQPVAANPAETAFLSAAAARGIADPQVASGLASYAAGRTVTVSAAAPTAAAALSGDANTAMLLDARFLPAGAPVRVDGVGFLSVVGAAMVTGGAGANSLLGDEAAQTFYAGEGDDTAAGGGGDDAILGNLGDDQLYGNLGTDSLFGGQGGDSLFGGQGDDVAYGNMEGDVMYGNMGSDMMFGGQGADLMFGGQGDDVIMGNLDGDALFGNLGNDTLNGGAGADTLAGGAGADAFRYDRTTDGGDTITDFEAGIDKIAVYSPNFGSLPTGVLSASHFALDNPATADQWFVFNTATGVLSYDADGSGAGAAVVIATLNVRSFANTDILVLAS